MRIFFYCPGEVESLVMDLSFKLSKVNVREEYCGQIFTGFDIIILLQQNFCNPFRIE